MFAEGKKCVAAKRCETFSKNTLLKQTKNAQFFVTSQTVYTLKNTLWKEIISITEKWRRMREENNELQQRNANRYKGNAPRQLSGRYSIFDEIDEIYE